MNKRLLLLTVLGVALVGGAYVRAQFGDKPSKLDVVKLKDDLFVIHNDTCPRQHHGDGDQRGCHRWWTTSSRSTSPTSWPG